jgi:hypothetical protein
MIELNGHTPELRECVRLLNEAILLVRIEVSDLLVPLFRCRDLLAANHAPGADAVGRRISMVHATQAVVHSRGAGAAMLLARLQQVEAILVQIRGERSVVHSPDLVPSVQGIRD